jgi:hypothetical protein
VIDDIKKASEGHNVHIDSHALEEEQVSFVKAKILTWILGLEQRTFAWRSRLDDNSDSWQSWNEK